MQSAASGQVSFLPILPGIVAGFSIAARWSTPELKPLETKQLPQVVADQISFKGLDSQALAALGTARVNHGAATTGLHADQETVGTGAADFGRLVSAFHFESLLLDPDNSQGNPRLSQTFSIAARACI